MVLVVPKLHRVFQKSWFIVNFKHIKCIIFLLRSWALNVVAIVLCWWLPSFSFVVTRSWILLQSCFVSSLSSSFILGPWMLLQFALSNFVLKSPIVSNSINHDFLMYLSRLFPYFNLNKEFQSQAVSQNNEIRIPRLLQSVFTNSIYIRHI